MKVPDVQVVRALTEPGSKNSPFEPVSRKLELYVFPPVVGKIVMNSP